jgi:hypothetical protein
MKEKNQMNVDAFREMAAAMRSRQGFGAIIKFTKDIGWTANKDTDLNGAQLLALAADIMHGFVLWLDGKPAEYHIGFIRSNFKPPRRDMLGHTDKSLWKYDNDPWQATVAVPLLDLNDGALFTFTTSSQGGKDCVANLLDAFSNNLEMHPGDARKLPLVALSRDSYKHASYGKVAIPLFDVVKWIEPPPDLKPILPPAPPSGPMFGLIEHEHKPIDRDDRLIEHVDRPIQNNGYQSPTEIDDDIPF